MNLAELTLDTFLPLRGTIFALRALDGEIAAELVSVTASPHPVPEGVRTPFTLLWTGPDSPQLQQGTHVVAHPDLDAELELFLVPVGGGAGGQPQYEAVLA